MFFILFFILTLKTDISPSTLRLNLDISFLKSRANYFYFKNFYFRISCVDCKEFMKDESWKDRINKIYIGIGIKFKISHYLFYYFNSKNNIYINQYGFQSFVAFQRGRVSLYIGLDVNNILDPKNFSVFGGISYNVYFDCKTSIDFI